jgi:hypothetical protein
MTTRLLALLASVSAPLLVGCSGGGGDDGGGDDGATAPECQLDTVGEKSPGFPYSIDKFRNDVLPKLLESCSGGACHAPTANGGFQLWADALTNDCNFGKSFNEVASIIDLQVPENSRLTIVTTERAGHVHPFEDTSGPGYLAMKDYIDTAKAALDAEGGGTEPPPVGDNNPFDFAFFKSDVQPAMDRAGCGTVGGCHGSGLGGFTIKAQATADADLVANFNQAVGKSPLGGEPSAAPFYFRATNAHVGSTAMAAADAQRVLKWITDAKNKAPDNGNIGCAPLENFNVGVFEQEILPILSGELDYNEPDRQGSGNGCMSSACHGRSRGPGTLTLLASDSPETTLQNFACFVDLTSPSQSEVLSCPTDGGQLAGCRTNNHPGGDFFDGANDLNYQRIIGFLLGSKSDVSPHDFAFFSRKINPIFNDPEATVDGGQVETCSGTGACHGVAVVGQPPPNGSDFGIIPNASEITALTANFAAATGFVSFLFPEQSSLFLYPTDEIANRDNPFATGLPHPGGPDFAVDSEEGLLILKWAAGLRPDNQGFVRDWLVLGDFPAQLITDNTLVREADVNPKIFDRGGGSFNNGEWDGFFSEEAEVDLNIPFNRNATGGRVAYASNYIINTDSRDIDAQVIVDTDNPVRIYINGVLAATSNNGGTVTAIANLPAASKREPTTHVLIKLLQRANDADFAFTAQVQDDIGNVLTDETGELVFTLAPDGGI